MSDRDEIIRLAEREEMILAALTKAYEGGFIVHAQMSPAFDVTVARAAALRALLSKEPTPGRSE